MSMFTNPNAPRNDFPRLKGKAAEIKNFVPALAWVWHFWMDEDELSHRQIELGLRMSARIDAILADNVFTNILPEAQRQEFSHCVWVFLACQNAAAMHFGGQGDVLFDVTIKSHHLAHWALEVNHINPRRGWCYAGEAFMNRMKFLGASAVRGNTPGRAAIKSLEKYRCALHFMFRQTCLM